MAERLYTLRAGKETGRHVVDTVSVTTLW